MVRYRSAIPVKIAKLGYIVLSLFFIGCGITLIVNPHMSLDVIGKVAGIAMCVFGCVKIVGYFSKDLYRLAFQFDLQFGIILIALGLFIFFKFDDNLDYIRIGLGFMFLCDGLFKTRISFGAKSFGIKLWWIVFGMSIAISIAGLLMIFLPFERDAAKMTYFGALYIAEGLLNLIVAITMVNQKSEILDVKDDDVSC